MADRFESAAQVAGSGSAAVMVWAPAGFTKIPYSEMEQKYLGPIS